MSNYYQSSRYQDTDPQKYKLSNNETLLEMCKSIWCHECLREKGKVFFLDGPRMISSSVFHDSFQSLYICQNNKKDYDEMVKTKEKLEYNNVHITYASVKNFTTPQNMHILNSCQLLYLDYMNCIYGSITKKQYPLHDLDKILKNSTNDIVVLGLTFVSRMIILKKEQKKIRQMEEEEDKTIKRKSTRIMWYEFLLPVIRSRGFDIETYKCVEYCKEKQQSAPMVFFAIILKRKSNMPIQVFHFHPSNIFRVGFDQDDPEECYQMKKTSKQYKRAFSQFYDKKKQQWRLPYIII